MTHSQHACASQPAHVRLLLMCSSNRTGRRGEATGGGSFARAHGGGGAGSQQNITSALTLNLRGGGAAQATLFLGCLFKVRSSTVHHLHWLSTGLLGGWVSHQHVPNDVTGLRGLVGDGGQRAGARRCHNAGLSGAAYQTPGGRHYLRRINESRRAGEKTPACHHGSDPNE